MNATSTRRPVVCARCLLRLRASSTRHNSSTSSANSISPGLLTAQPQTLHSYRTTRPPNAAQLSYAHKFFKRSPPPQVLWTTPYFRAFPASPYPEVCFLGRSNVGKSSLLNALFGRPSQAPANVSRTPGRTRTMNAYAVGKELSVQSVGGGKMGGTVHASHGGEEGVLVVLDMPGYGAASREEWGKEIMKVLENRRQLRRTFVLIDAEHGPKSQDLAILRHLAEKGISHQILLSKVDKIIHPREKGLSPKHLDERLGRLSRTLSDLQEQLIFKGVRSTSLGDILSCSASRKLGDNTEQRDRIGIDAIRWAMLSACGLECDEHGLAGRRQPDKHKRTTGTMSVNASGGLA
ncbi:hypothetical protein ANO11243_058590 [Dothideomycetidae sp. 11243]|nr:hypothetical protein ANO11243_058590 [fungal sp. No.11243]